MKFNNLNQLYDYICKQDMFKQITKLLENKIIIVFHDDFIIEIEEKHYFDIYVNEYFYYSIENEEILDFLLEIINKKIAFIEDIRKRKIIQIPYAKINKYSNRDNKKIIYFLD